MITTDTIDAYLRAGRELIPLHLAHGKRPRDNNWRYRPYAREELVEHAQRGGNLGWRLGPRDVVIDVESDGLFSWAVLEDKYTLSLLNQFTPLVHTGGGGLHYYTQLPEGATPPAVHHADYPGIEFKSLGAQVVIAGSVHPRTGVEYSFAPNAPTDDAIEIPIELRELFARPERTASAECSTDATTITSDQLAALLSQVPVETYSTNDAWFPLLAAAYHATAGDGLDQFLEWSLSDPQFSTQRTNIITRWCSLSKTSSTADGATRGLGTLLREAALHGGQGLPELRAQQCGELLSVEALPEPAAAPQRPAMSFDTVLSVIGDIESGDATIPTALLCAVSELTGDEYKRALSALAKRADVPRRLVESAVLQAALEKDRAWEIDLLAQGIDWGFPALAAEAYLRERHDGGRTLVYAADERFWVYRSGAWEPRQDHFVEHDLRTYIPDLAVRAHAKKINLHTVVSQTLKALKDCAARDVDFFRLRTDEHVTRICCNNGTLELESITGRYRLREHRPEDYLITRVPVEFREDAKCPLFDGTLSDIFSNSQKPEELISLLWEIYGYTMQPVKNIASWFLFHGGGCNGKSVVLEILAALLGPAVVHRSMREFFEDKHALAGLSNKLALIDDDLQEHTTLRDDILKKLSENKSLTARPIYKEGFDFRNIATVIMASNSWPQTRDLSEGMLRRANVIPFDYQIPDNKRDYDRARRIIAEELPGVLLKALRGLIRLRKRGRFGASADSELAKSAWTRAGHQILAFVDEQYETVGLGDPSTKVTVKDVWASYQQWCRESGVERRFTRQRLIESLTQYGWRLDKHRGRAVFIGIRAIYNEESSFEY